MSILKIIKKIFNIASVQQTETRVNAESNKYYFHEDYYCQIEFLPKENFISASKVATEIIEHSEKTFDGYGWTGSYMRNHASIPTKSKNFKVTEFADFLCEEGFSEYPGVTTGYATLELPCVNTRAFKKQSIVICVDFKNDTIENIWHNTPPSQVDNEIYKQFLQSISHKYNLLLVDWWKSIIVDISNPEEIDKYFVYDE